MPKLIAAIALPLSGLTVTAVYAGTPAFGHDFRERDHRHFAAPEIDPSSGISALTLLLGGLSVMRSRIGKK